MAHEEHGVQDRVHQSVERIDLPEDQTQQPGDVDLLLLLLVTLQEEHQEAHLEDHLLTFTQAALEMHLL